MKLTEGCDVMNLSEAKTLYKKCDCNGFYIYTEYGEEVSREFRALVTDKLLRKWEKEKVSGRMPFLFRKETEHSVFAFSMWHLEWHSE